MRAPSSCALALSLVSVVPGRVRSYRKGGVTLRAVRSHSGRGRKAVTWVAAPVTGALGPERTRKGRGKIRFSFSTVSGAPDGTHWDTTPTPEPAHRTLRKPRGWPSSGVKFHAVSSFSNPDRCEFGFGVPTAGRSSPSQRQLLLSYLSCLVSWESGWALCLPGACRRPFLRVQGQGPWEMAGLGYGRAPFVASILPTAAGSQGNSVLPIFGSSSGSWEACIFCTLLGDTSRVHAYVIKGLLVFLQ